MILSMIPPDVGAYRFRIMSANFHSEAIQINICIDGDLKESRNLMPGSYQDVGEWHVSKGVHTAEIHCRSANASYGIVYQHEFKSPSTKEVWMGFGPSTIEVRW